jgi:hypothetical protein
MGTTPVDVRTWDPSVNTGLLAVRPDKVNPVKVGVAPVWMDWGNDNVMAPLPLVTTTWLAVPVNVALVKVLPVVLPISS